MTTVGQALADPTSSIHAKLAAGKRTTDAFRELLERGIRDGLTPEQASLAAMRRFSRGS